MSKPINDLTAEEVRAAVSYDAETGLFTWKRRPLMSASWNGRFPGKRAGTTDSADHVWVAISGRRYAAHRLAWVIMTGQWPVDIIDHRNLIKSDNSWDNLRPSDFCQNLSNKPAPKVNTSGYKGVTFCKITGRWMAQIGVRNKHIYLGRCDTPEEAFKLYQAAAQRHHGEFANISNGKQ